MIWSSYSQIWVHVLVKQKVASLLPAQLLEKTRHLHTMARRKRKAAAAIANLKKAAKNCPYKRQKMDKNSESEAVEREESSYTEKRIQRMYPESSKEDQLEINTIAALESIPLQMMRKFANRSLRFMDAYIRGLNGLSYEKSMQVAVRRQFPANSSWLSMSHVQGRMAPSHVRRKPNLTPSRPGSKVQQHKKSSASDLVVHWFNPLDRQHAAYFDAVGKLRPASRDKVGDNFTVSTAVIRRNDTAGNRLFKLTKND
ncbi:hypothetical protein CPB84DRAFT_1823054 [Gymnopilus junonius]|uniref:Uncharacterized protein n=1 Tax=Gymnopilus junonius TaxID=109634 RepID=A0A9P5NVP5_GYMJU|nr:hypothetical protein CPB84DRAFT_1823054 [Gymnopilus junonius]